MNTVTGKKYFLSSLPCAHTSSITTVPTCTPTLNLEPSGENGHHAADGHPDTPLAAREQVPNQTAQYHCFFWSMPKMVFEYLIRFEWVQVYWAA